MNTDTDFEALLNDKTVHSTRVSMILLSHLSDVQAMNGVVEMPEMIDNRLNFVKFLILKYNDTSVEIDPDKEYGLFRLKSAKVSADEIKTLNEIFEKTTRILIEQGGPMIVTTPVYLARIPENAMNETGFSKEKVEAAFSVWFDAMDITDYKKKN